MLRSSTAIVARFVAVIALVHFTSPVLAQDGLRPLKADLELTAMDGAFEFDGMSDVGMDRGALNLGSSGFVDVSDGDFTVHAWVKFASRRNSSSVCWGPGCDMSIVDKMNNYNENGWRLLKQSDNHFWFCLGTWGGCWDGGPNTVISQTVAVRNVWYSVAAVKTSTEMSIYVNGVLEASAPVSEFIDSQDASLLIGGNYEEGANLNGQVARVQLFRSALSAPLVRALFESSKASFR